MRARSLSMMAAVALLLLAGCGADPVAASSTVAAAETTALPAGTTTSRSAVMAPPLNSSSDVPTTPTAAPVITSEVPVSTSAEPPPPPPPPTTSTTTSTSTTSTSTPPTTKSVSAPTADGVVAGAVVVVDPGHNGANGANSSIINKQVDAGFGEMKACNTTGTATNAGSSEHAFNWAVSLKVKALLEAQGVTVIMTRSSDDGIGPCVDERAAVGNDSNADAVVSIHGDGSAQGNHGFFAMTSKRQPNGDAIAGASVDLAGEIRDALVAQGLSTSNYIGTDGLTKRDDLAGLNLSMVPTMMVEMGNMRDSGDAALMTSEDGQNRMAAGIAQGVLDYLTSH